MLGHLRLSLMVLCLAQIGCASYTVSFDNQNRELWSRYIFEAFDTYAIQLSVPPNGWEGDHTRGSLSLEEAEDNNIFISLYYDYTPGKRKHPRSELFMGIGKRTGEFTKNSPEMIGQREWSIYEFKHSKSGVSYVTVLNDEYIFYVTLSMPSNDFSKPSFLQPRLEVLKMVIESLTISER